MSIKPPSITIPTVSIEPAKMAAIMPTALTIPKITPPKVILPTTQITALTGPSAIMGCLPKITLPQITLPTIVLPNIDLPTISIPKIEIPKIEIPKIEIPKIEIPKISIPKFTLPTISLPSITLPQLTLPKIQLPSLTLPQITLPKIILPNLTLPQITIPQIEIPKIEIPKISIPKIEIPKFTLPTIELPKIQLPEIVLPKIQLPQIVLPTITLPTITIPDLHLPSIQLPAIRIPEIQLPTLPPLPKISLPPLPEFPKITIPKIDLACLSIPAVTLFGAASLPKTMLPNIKLPSAEMPKYAFRPQAFKNPSMRTVTTRRARLWAGGTYFRSMNPGKDKNNIFLKTYIENGDTFLIISNRNTGKLNSISGDCDIDITQNRLDDNEILVIYKNEMVIKKYKIPLITKCKIQLKEPYTLPAPVLSMPISFSSKITVGDTALEIKSMKDTGVIISAKNRVYKLAPKHIPSSNTSGEQTEERNGWDIRALRALINADDPWVEMVPRPEIGATSSNEAGTSTQAWNINDVQDHAPGDDLVLSQFAETSLAGGDGLPDSPNLENTGGVRAVIFVNTGENKDGTVAEHNTVYEWAGEDSTNGAWKPL